MTTLRRPLLQEALAAATRSSHPKPFQTTFTSNPTWPYSANRIPSSVTPIRIAVLDSSFNPPTKAHYHLLKSAANVGCDAVLLLLATNNADKGQTGAGAIERLEMMEAMAMDTISNEKEETALSKIAVGLTIHARFMDKAKPILDQFEPNTIQLSWIMGHDTIVRLFDPKYYKDIRTDMAPFFAQCDIICSSRPGFGDREEMMGFVNRSGYNDKVTLIDIEAQVDSADAKEGHSIDIKSMSSTIVRNAVKNSDWKTVDACVLPSVRVLIEKNTLYTNRL